MKLPKVYNLENDTYNDEKGCYNKALNQFVIETPTMKVFQSHETLVAYIENGKVYVIAKALEKAPKRKWWEGPNTTPNSKTTRKHLYIFLRDHADMNIHSIRDLRSYVKQGRIIAKKSF
jgi:hypothetical protein